MNIKIIRAPTKTELFKKVRQEKGDLSRMSYLRIKGEHRMTIVFK